MSFELLKSNVKREEELIRDIKVFSDKLQSLRYLESQGRLDISKNQKQLLEKSIYSLTTQLKIINSAIPDVVNSIKFYKGLEKGTGEELKLGEGKTKGLLKVEYNHPAAEGSKVGVAIPKSEEKKFLESLTSHDLSVQKLKEEKAGSSQKAVIKPSLFIKYSNKFFRETANKIIAKGYFQDINFELRKITSPIILGSYISMMLFGTVLAFIAGLVIFAVMLLLKISIISSLLALIAIPVVTFLLFYSYPSSQRKTLEKEINQELPFVAIYMAAIATSGIEPSKIFSILIAGKDYPFTQREVKKLLNYINFYGYDIVSALKYAAKTCPSDRLSQLFSGMSTTITSGGELSTFLDKHAETLLFDYRLEREKYTKVAETFMDIYISVVIAAPMILMMMFILLGLTGFGGAFLTPSLISGLIVFIISTLNVMFIIFLNLKQPKF